MSALGPWSKFEAHIARMEAEQAMMDAERVARLAFANRIRRHRTATLIVGFSLLALVAFALPWAEAAVEDWVDVEEAKAAQAYRRTP